MEHSLTDDEIIYSFVGADVSLLERQATALVPAYCICGIRGGGGVAGWLLQTTAEFSSLSD